MARQGGVYVECVEEVLYVLCFVFRDCVLQVARIFVFNVVILVNYIYGYYHPKFSVMTRFFSSRVCCMWCMKLRLGSFVFLKNKILRDFPIIRNFDCSAGPLCV